MILDEHDKYDKHDKYEIARRTVLIEHDKDKLYSPAENCELFDIKIHTHTNSSAMIGMSLWEGLS